MTFKKNIQPLLFSSVAFLFVYCTRTGSEISPPTPPISPSDFFVTYGGSDNDIIKSIKPTPDGGYILVGQTKSINSTADGGDFTSNKGDIDILLIKVNSSGKRVGQLLLGGTQEDVCNDVAINNTTGAIYIAGHTFSSDGIFTGIRKGGAAGRDIFVIKINQNLDASSINKLCIGGSSQDFCAGIAISSSGDVFLAGGTLSTDVDLMGKRKDVINPTTLQDGLLVKLDANLTDATKKILCIGDHGQEELMDIAISNSGDVYAVGITSQSLLGSADVPRKSLTSVSVDGFALKINNNLQEASKKVICIGGNNDDFLWSVAVSSTNDVYLTGYTKSIDVDLSMAMRKDNTNPTMFYDGIIVKLNANLDDATKKILCIGGTNEDKLNSVEISTDGSVYVGGGTNSIDIDLASKRKVASTTQSDALLLKLNANLDDASKSILCLGGGNNDNISALCVDNSGRILSGGSTNSLDGDILFGYGNLDGWLAKKKL